MIFYLSLVVLLCCVSCLTFSFVTMRFTTLLTSAISFGVALAAPAQLDKRYMQEENGVNYHVFEHAATGAKIRYVKNSGICETTPGVNQYSGYLSVGSNQNMCMAIPFLFTSILINC